METKEYTGWRHGTSKQHTPPRKSKKKTKLRKENPKIIPLPLWHWVAHLGPFWSPVTPRHFAWQAWHLVTSTFVLRGRRGTSQPPSFCLAGVALMALGGALGPALVAGDAAALCVAAVALGDIYLRFAW